MAAWSATRRRRGPPRIHRGSRYAARPKEQDKRFNGYKQHIAADLETDLILACAVTPANRPGGGSDAGAPDGVGTMGPAHRESLDRPRLREQLAGAGGQSSRAGPCWQSRGQAANGRAPRAIWQAGFQDRHAGEDHYLPSRSDGAIRAPARSWSLIRRSAAPAPALPLYPVRIRERPAGPYRRGRGSAAEATQAPGNVIWPRTAAGTDRRRASPRTSRCPTRTEGSLTAARARISSTCRRNRRSRNLDTTRRTKEHATNAAA